MPARSLSPRKTPRQERSRETVAAIFEASIQVLLRVGLDRLTTTAVAERAGVSVGTLYQYFPNKRALLSAVLQQHLAAVADAVVSAADGAVGRSRREIAAAVVRAFVLAKFTHPAQSRALYAIAADVGGPAIVRSEATKAQRAVAHALSTASDLVCARDAEERATMSWFLVTMMVGPVQEALVAGAAAPSAEMLCRELTTAVVGYLAARERQYGTDRSR